MKIKDLKTALRDKEGRLRLRVSAIRKGRVGVSVLRAYTLHGKRAEKTVGVCRENVPDYLTPQEVADTLVAICDLIAMNNDVHYVIDNPDRIDTLRAGRWAKGPKYPADKLSASTKE